MRKIIVTGGSGKAGRATIRELLEHGYEVANLDLVPSSDPIAPFTHIELTDFGETMDALSGLEGRLGMRGAEAIVHLAAIPSSAMRSNEATFRVNTISAYNVFHAATKLGFERVVWAASETALGLPFDRAPPAYAPLDEEAPVLPESSYALAKILGE
jgi:nucleoside-diphosphate-sugar epimerase